MKFSKALCFAVDSSDLAGHGVSERDKGKEREVDDGTQREPGAKKARKESKHEGVRRISRRGRKIEVQVC